MVWQQLIQLKEDEGVDKKELLQLWQQVTHLLSDCLNEEEPDNETQNHVRHTNNPVIQKAYSWFASCCGSHKLQFSLHG